jgi:hypothetical protein
VGHLVLASGGPETGFLLPVPACLFDGAGFVFAAGFLLLPLLVWFPLPLLPQP